MNISLDRQRCTGHGRCYSLVPELIEGDDDGYGLVISIVVPAELEDRARVAVMNCPEDAISLHDAHDKETT